MQTRFFYGLQARRRIRFCIPPLQYGKWRIWNGARKQQRKQRGAALTTRRRPVETGLDRMPYGFGMGAYAAHARYTWHTHHVRKACVKKPLLRNLAIAPLATPLAHASKVAYEKRSA